MKRVRKLEVVRGEAHLEHVRAGTGSAHWGVVLRTATGERLTLVRLGSNPFNDTATRELTGRTIEAEGYRVGNEFRYTVIRDVEGNVEGTASEGA